MKNNWPELNYTTGKDCWETLHLFTQIVGKIKLARLPWVNHSWHITLLVTPTGFTTGNIPYPASDFQIDFDFTDHQLKICTSKGQFNSFGLQQLSVSEFYQKIFEALRDLNIEISIHKIPNELEAPIPFDEDTTHKTYDPEQVMALHQAFLKANDVFLAFRAKFIGKCSPVHLFWGSFDLAVSRFSGRTAPLHPGGVPHLPDRVAQEAYSHEVSSCGFWPGSEMVPYPAFYAYQYPEPEDYKEATIEPKSAFYHVDLREFILPYADVQQSDDPEKTLLIFLESTYAAGARLANWDRKALEKDLSDNHS